MKGLPIGTPVSAYDTNEQETILILDNQGIIHTRQKGSILSLLKMRAYGMDVNECPEIFNRDGNKVVSSLIADRYEVNFKLQDGMDMVHVQEATKYELKTCPVVVMISYMVWNTKDVSDHYLAQNHTGTLYPDNSKTVVDSTVSDILKYRLEA